MEDKSGNIWAGTSKFLAKSNGSDWTIYNSNNSSLSDTAINCLSEDSEDKIWIGTAVGLTVYDKNAISIKSLPKAGNTSFIQNIFFNQFHNSFSIKFSILHPGRVVISIYNIHGQMIKKLHTNFYNPGDYSLTWDGKNSGNKFVNSGTYIVNFVCETAEENYLIQLIE